MTNNHREQTASPAFTLVEILVVLSVITLLLAILLPSLRQAREQGKRTVCAVHLKGLSTSWEVYTIEYGSPPQLARRGVDINYDCHSQFDCRPMSIPGFGPQYFDSYLTANSDNQVWISATSYRHVLFQVSNPPPSGPLPGHYWNWGLMWLSQAVQQPQIFFCPAVRDPDYAWKTSLNPWPPSVATMWRPDFPYRVNHTDASYERRVALTGVNWDSIPLQTAIAHDIAAPRVTKIAHKTGGNIAYRDGHVVFLKGSQFANWWSLEDSWTKTPTRLKLLQYSYWLDTEGHYPFDPTTQQQP